jgi:hypothetical protein
LRVDRDCDLGGGAFATFLTERLWVLLSAAGDSSYSGEKLNLFGSTNAERRCCFLFIRRAPCREVLYCLLIGGSGMIFFGG